MKNSVEKTHIDPKDVEYLYQEVMLPLEYVTEEPKQPEIKKRESLTLDILYERKRT